MRSPISADFSCYWQEMECGRSWKYVSVLDMFPIFAIFGLPADGDELDHRALRSHYRMTLMPHVFERGTATSPKTQGPEIPTWEQVNKAKDIFYNVDQVGLRSKIHFQDQENCFVLIFAFAYKITVCIRYPFWGADEMSYSLELI